MICVENKAPKMPTTILYYILALVTTARQDNCMSVSAFISQLEQNENETIDVINGTGLETCRLVLLTSSFTLSCTQTARKTTEL